MFKPNSFIKSLKHQDDVIRDEFTILCWNVAKLTLNASYKKFTDLLIEEFDFDIEIHKCLNLSIEVFRDIAYYLRYLWRKTVKPLTVKEIHAQKRALKNEFINLMLTITRNANLTE